MIMHKRARPDAAGRLPGQAAKAQVRAPGMGPAPSLAALPLPLAVAGGRCTCATHRRVLAVAQRQARLVMPSGMTVLFQVHYTPRLPLHCAVHGTMLTHSYCTLLWPCRMSASHCKGCPPTEGDTFIITKAMIQPISATTHQTCIERAHAILC